MSPAIKLFGKTISFSPGNNKVVSDITDSDQEQQSTSATAVSSVDNKEVSGCMTIKTKKHEDNSASSTGETLAEAATLSSTSDGSKTPSPDKGPLSPKTPNKDEPSEASFSQEQTLKKPDKLLPCPRCNSMNTKFCYYNNYNVSQPRHFCKNCQRYWTAGGTMRNVAVGSGRRKNKTNPNPNYHHIIVADDFSLNPNRFLMFGSNGTERPENRVPSNFYQQSSQHSSRTINSAKSGCNEEKQVLRLPILNNTPSHIPCFPQPVFGPSGIPITFYPTIPIPYWGGPMGTPTSTLGKHSREGTILTPPNSEMENLSGKIIPKNSVLIPKTLRIDDPNEAAKSSIWSTLGIKNNERSASIQGTSPFKAFAGKGDRTSNVDNASMVLQANPAALSRSFTFHETV